MNRVKGLWVRGLSSSGSACRQTWDVLCAVSLERSPVVTRQLTQVEDRVDKLLKQTESENSFKSDFELRMKQDEKVHKLLKSGKLDVDELDKAGQQTAHDFLDSCIAEAKAFRTAPRVNDRVEGDVRSVKRALDRHLLLVVRDKLGWLLPQGPHCDGETLRQTAERVLKQKCGSSVSARFYGNAPNGFYKYKYPKSLGRQSVGAKIFFYKAQYLDGPLNIDSDYQWATRAELTLLPHDYCKSVKMFLIDEH